MTIDGLLKTKDFTYKDVREHFELEREIENIDIFRLKGCYNCGNTDRYEHVSPYNNDWSWIHLYLCRNCNRLLLHNYGDRMGGAMDAIEIYKEGLIK